MVLATCFSLSIVCSGKWGKTFLILLPCRINLRPGLAICMHALTLFLYVLQFLSLEIIRKKISKAEANDAMFYWEICWSVKRIGNSMNSQIRFKCQNESEVSASGFLKKAFFFCVNHCNLLNFAAPVTAQMFPLPSATRQIPYTEQLTWRPLMLVTTRLLASASGWFATTETSPTLMLMSWARKLWIQPNLFICATLPPVEC